MKCPVCDEKMESMVCTCGYDASRDYEKYPTFGMLSVSVESVGCLRDRRNNLLRCAGCGYYGFTMSCDTGEMKCVRCGQVPMENEMESVVATRRRSKVELESIETMQVRRKQDLDILIQEKDRVLKNLDELVEQKVRSQAEMDAINISLHEKRAELCAMDDRLAASYQRLAALHRQADEMDKVLADLNSRVNQKMLEREGLHTQRNAHKVHSGNPMFKLQDMRKPSYRIKSIAADYEVIVAAYTDGTVKAIGKPYYGRCEVSNWRNVVSVAVCDMHTIGLTGQGTILCTGRGEIPRMVSKWQDIIAISANKIGVFGLRRDGRVMAANGGVAKEAIAQWSRIKAISAGAGYVVGLRWDGTVVAAGRNDKGQCQVSDWRKIKAISAGIDCTIGLDEDGLIVNTGAKYRFSGRYAAIYQNNSSDYTDFVYGLDEARGAVWIYGYKETYEEMKTWGELEALAVFGEGVIGLKADGTVVSAGTPFASERDVSELNRGVV